MGRIARLHPLVSSQIAAGEVVERPASAIKELVENALDASATRITVEFEDGGLSLMRVFDNGVGMAPDDAVLALERFATSKLASVDDLCRISSMGFRGEALPSIASCSRLTLETRAADRESGTEVLVEGGTVVATYEKGLPPGTTVTVRDLFYNTPARLRFVKSRVGERQAIIDCVMRLSLAWPKVSFVVRSGDKTVFATTGQGLKSAVLDVFGPEDVAAMVEVLPSDDSISVSGFIGLPSLYRRQRDRQIFSVNGRPIRDTGLSWALDSAYAGLIPPRTYPAAILNINLPTDEVDVNVHPTKSQVKFRDEARVKRVLSRDIGGALSDSGLRRLKESQEIRARPLPPSTVWSIARDSVSSSRQHQPLVVHGNGFSFVGETSRSISGLWTREGKAGEDEPPWEYMGSIADTYLIASTGSSVLIIDKHALMESLTYRSLLKGQSGRQDLLMAEMVRLDPKEAAAFEDLAETLDRIGFVCRLVGDRTALVTSVPLVLGKTLSPSSLKEILANLTQDAVADKCSRHRTEAASVSPERLLDSARIETAACHASVRAREPLTAEEARALLSSLQEQPDAKTCPHGRPVLREMTLKELADYFGRTSHAG